MELIGLPAVSRMGSVEEAHEGHDWAVGGRRPPTTMEDRGATLKTMSWAAKTRVGTLGSTGGEI